MSNSKRVTSNLLWRLFERFFAQGVTFVVSVVLARKLDPEVYGTIALVTVFTAILEVFIPHGIESTLEDCYYADNQRTRKTQICARECRPVFLFQFYSSRKKSISEEAT